MASCRARLHTYFRCQNLVVDESDVIRKMKSLSTHLPLIQHVLLFFHDVLKDHERSHDSWPLLAKMTHDMTSATNVEFLGHFVKDSFHGLQKVVHTARRSTRCKKYSSRSVTQVQENPLRWTKKDKKCHRMVFTTGDGIKMILEKK